MKVTLYFVSRDNWVDSNLEGLYTEKEFENFKKEVIENYRECGDYVYDITKYIDEPLICKAALGREEEVKDFKNLLHIMEEEILKDFINDYVTIYEKEL